MIEIISCLTLGTVTIYMWTSIIRDLAQIRSAQKIEIESINENDLYDFGNDIYDLFALIEKDVIVYRLTNISFFKERYIGQVFVKYKRLSDIELTVNNLINIFKNKSGFKIKIDPNSYDY